jgi:hypothetical protein
VLQLQKEIAIVSYLPIENPRENGSVTSLTNFRLEGIFSYRSTQEPGVAEGQQVLWRWQMLRFSEPLLPGHASRK